MKVKGESEVDQSSPTLATPWTSRLLRPWDFPGKSTGVGAVATPMGAVKITEAIDYIGDYCILFGHGKSWYRIWCLSVREACSALGMLSAWLPGTQSKVHWEYKMEFPSFSRWSQLGLFLSSFSPREISHSPFQDSLDITISDAA